MEKNAILFSVVDREDYWVTGGLVFKVKNTSTYEDAYNEIKTKLEKPELVEYIIKKQCLLEDLFKYDETYKFKETKWERHSLIYFFVNKEEDVVEYKFKPDFVLLND